MTVKEKKRKAPTAERNAKARKQAKAKVKPVKKRTIRNASAEVIDLLDDESSADEEIVQPVLGQETSKAIIDDSSDEEFEFDA